MTARYDLMMDWLAAILPVSAAAVTPASTDASFRRYFRVRHDGRSVIVMDAPPPQEDCRPFVAVAGALAQLGLTVPKVLAADLEQGFLLLTDLGERQYLAALDAASAGGLYADALAALLRLQLGGDPATGLLPPYDAGLLRRELELFREWYLGRHLRLALGDAGHQALDDAFAALVASALEQPRVWVH
ncbi:MAG: phosphotransferase, partial [Pseudomonadota bacterium]|nr:phosphotransferase [Pseudomonadota bacterium]